MTYSVSWDPKVVKLLERLPRQTSKRIVLKVREVAENPFHYLEHYGGDDFHKLRVGDFRLLIDVDSSSRKLIVRVLGHRKKIYKKR